ncbi:MAG: right-handed parallel beta-helix repeat-containing protein [Phycisphaerales bacterium]
MAPWSARGASGVFDSAVSPHGASTRGVDFIVPDDVMTIQGAIDMAHDGDRVLIQPGTYYEALDFDGKDIYVGPLEGGKSKGKVIITRPEFTVTRDGLPPSLVTFKSGETAAAVLEGVILDGGDIDVERGALVCIDNASPTFSYVEFVGGHADTFGGGVWIAHGRSEFYNCYFDYNFASLAGGGVYVGSQGSPNFYGCYFYENHSEYGGGGAIYVSDRGDIELQECTFEDNEALTFGGAICLDTDHNNWITLCDFYANYALVGGAVSGKETSVMFAECYFAGNESCGDGGAFFAYESLSTFMYCQFDENTSYDCGINFDSGRGIEGHVGGGAIGLNLGEADLVHCNFYYNDSYGYGGGGALGARDVDLGVTDCLFEHNYCEHYGGGGIQAVNGYSSIQRTYFNGNAASEDLRWEGDTVGGGVALRFEGIYVPSGGVEPAPLGEIINCVFDRNYGQSGGGGVFVYGTGVDIVNCTFYRNETGGDDNEPDLRGYPPFGGAIFAYNMGPLDINIANSIAWDNYPDQIYNPGDELGGGPAPIVQYSDIDGGIPIYFNDAGGNIDADPRFVDPDGNDPWDFESHDLSLRENSPCIDAANTPLLESFDGDEYDILLQERVLDDTGTADTGVAGSSGDVVDMGAFEFQGTSGPEPVVCGPADMADPLGVLDYSDVLYFITAFGEQNPVADLAEPFGAYDFSDVFAYLQMFGSGCP